jgi:hypothetical protein
VAGIPKAEEEAVIGKTEKKLLVKMKEEIAITPFI